MSNEGRDEAALASTAMLGEVTIGELRSETDEVRALRKALLAMLAIHGECCGEWLDRFHAFLLLEFAPLADHFHDNKQLFIGAQEVVRGRTHEGSIALFLPEALGHLIATYEP